MKKRPKGSPPGRLPISPSMDKFYFRPFGESITKPQGDPFRPI